jgi:hypothetical protein
MPKPFSGTIGETDDSVDVDAHLAAAMARD